MEAWLAKNAHFPLRVMIAPSGFGKSTGLLNYALQKKDARLLCSFRQAVDGDGVIETLCDVLETPGKTYQEAFAALTARGACEILFDGIEWFDSTATALLERLVCEVPMEVNLIAAGSRTAFDLPRYSLRGAVVSIAPELLLFSVPEILTAAERLELALTEEQAGDIRERTDGWPIVVSDVLRVTAEAGCDPLEGYDRWLLLRGAAFLEVTRAELERMSAAARDIVSAMSGGLQPDAVQSERLHIEGAPVIGENGTTRILRVLSDLQPPAEAPAVSIEDPLHIRMFGRFSIRQRDNEVQWVRRRDQQIMRYLLLHPDTGARRSEIIEHFWPQAEAQLAAQSLRTACSNIRKALIRAMGNERAERFFRAESNRLVVDLTASVVDIARFKAHILGAQEAEANENWYDVLAHTAAAERLYRADLFAGEPLEEWFSAQREIYREMLDYAAALRVRLTADLEIEQRMLHTHPQPDNLGQH